MTRYFYKKMIKIYARLKQKAAMFGLDARIAVVILGLISLVAGVKLYASFPQMQASRMISDLNNLKVALNNFMADTQYKLTSYSTNSYFYNAEDLINLTIDSNIPYTLKYRGPYIDYNTGSDTNVIINPKTKINTYFISRSFLNS